MKPTQSVPHSTDCRGKKRLVSACIKSNKDAIAYLQQHHVEPKDVHQFLTKRGLKKNGEYGLQIKVKEIGAPNDEIPDEPTTEGIMEDEGELVEASTIQEIYSKKDEPKTVDARGEKEKKTKKPTMNVRKKFADMCKRALESRDITEFLIAIGLSESIVKKYTGRDLDTACEGPSTTQRTLLHIENMMTEQSRATRCTAYMDLNAYMIFSLTHLQSGWLAGGLAGWLDSLKHMQKLWLRIKENRGDEGPFIVENGLGLMYIYEYDSGVVRLDGNQPFFPETFQGRAWEKYELGNDAFSALEVGRMEKMISNLTFFQTMQHDLLQIPVVMKFSTYPSLVACLRAKDKQAPEKKKKDNINPQTSN
ncbi:hypothetical protein BSKO_04836 [Bryopsis sp. KO-2023]|nr:hypothetical protein BSKO_04836 [Bryopsis sp. KO-2023]